MCENLIFYILLIACQWVLVTLAINRPDILLIKDSDDKMQTTEKACNLGILFDCELSLQWWVNMVNDICKLGFYHVRHLAAISNMLDKDNSKHTNEATHALLHSRLW